MIRHFQPKAVPESRAPFSQVVVDDRYAYLSGLVAADFPEGTAVLGDIAAETTAVMNVIEAILAELDLGMNALVRADVHLTDLEHFDAMDTAYRTFFPDKDYPARTCTQSNRLFGGCLVEITCIARL